MEIYIGIIAGLMVWGLGATLFALWDAVDAERVKPVEVDAEWAAIVEATDRRDWA
jgi:hypothetical protein